MAEAAGILNRNFQFLFFANRGYAQNKGHSGMIHLLFDHPTIVR